MSATDPTIMAAPRRRKAGLAFATTATTLALGFTLLGCDEHRLSDRAALMLSSVETAHPITFHTRVEELLIEIPPRGDALSQTQYADVYRFARRFRAEANGHLTVSLPGTARPGVGYASALEDIIAALQEAEIPDAKVRRARHTRSHGGLAVLKLSYGRPIAVPPECGKWPRDVGHDHQRVPYPQWGCATQRNFAAMIANARDLQRPQEEDPRSAERRSATWSKYIAPDGAGGGAPPAADAPAKASPPPKK